MKFISVLLSVLLLFACDENGNKKKDMPELNIDWIVGNWERTNNNEDSQTFERWTKVIKDQYNTEYHGLGFTLSGIDTVFKEKLRIFPFDHSWIYEVVGVNPEPTNFPFTELTDTSFVCENELNDFPNKIAYQLQDKLLLATVSTGDKKIDFVFKKEK